MDHKESYLAEYPPEKNVFVMFRYADDDYHRKIEYNIRRAFKETDYFNPVIAKDLTPHVFPSISSAIDNAIAMSRFGIAVFSQHQNDCVNPNIAFELGIMRAQGKEVLILKDDKVQDLFSDINGIIWRSFSGSPKELGTDANSLLVHTTEWLKWQQESVNGIFGFSYLANVEQNIDLYPDIALKNLEKEVEKCLGLIADYSQLHIPDGLDLAGKTRHLYEKRQITFFFAKIVMKISALCHAHRGCGSLSRRARDRVIGYARIVRDMHNDWFRTFRVWRETEQFLKHRR